MSRIGLLADLHLGYTRGTRDNTDGVNVREQDVLDAGQAAVNNLVSAGVEAIVDLGDLFHVPAPKKRALLHAVHMINDSGLPWYSSNGNHTLQRTKSDLHVYDVLVDLCPKFSGYTVSVLSDIDGYHIPYGDEVEALQHVPPDAKFIAGHFACDDVPFPGEHVSVKDLPDIPTFLGHYHTRQLNMTVDYYVPEEAGRYDAAFKGAPPSATYQGPVYIGATERFAWGEANNPTGVAVFDTETKIIEFIEHKTREWVDVATGAEGAIDDLRGRDFEGKIVRVNVEGSPAEYHGLDIKAIRDIARSALEFTIRRAGSVEAFTPDKTDTQTYSLLDAWGAHVERTKMPKVQRGIVRTIGERALASAGVGE